MTVKLAKHEEAKKSKGYAFIQYSSQDDALLAMEQMDQRVPYLNPTLLLSFPPLANVFQKRLVSHAMYKQVLHDF